MLTRMSRRFSIFRALVVFASVGLIGCSGNGGNGGGGSGNGGSGNGGSGNGLTFSYNNLAGSFKLVDQPDSDEGTGIVSLISIMKGDNVVKGAELTVNGVRIPADGLGRFDVSSVRGLKIMPGSRVSLVATHGAEEAKASFECPNDLTITAPQENATAQIGDQLAVSWNLAKDDPYIPGASLILNDYNFSAARSVDILLPDATPRYQEIDKRALSASVTVPEHLPPQQPDLQLADGYSVELWVPGVPAADSVGRCTLVRRVHIHVK
jgi:hypothetical protein